MNKRAFIDIFIWVAATMLCLMWRFAAEKMEVWNYVILFAVLAGLWLLIGWIMRLYKSYKGVWLWQAYFSLAATSATLTALSLLTLHLFQIQLSPNVMTWTIGVVTSMSAIVILMEHYWKYATNMTVPVLEIEQRQNARVSRPDEKRSDESMATIRQSVLSITTPDDYEMLLSKARLDSRQTKVICNKELFGIMQIPDYQYATIVDLTLLNDARGINRRFCTANQKLPDDGRYICCYRPQEYVRKKIISRYPLGLGYLVYGLYFIHKRIIPRLALTSRLYFDVTRGRKRMLSKTEVLGRLYYCGFEVDEIVPMGHIEYIIAHRKSQPYPQEQQKLYGPLIKLPRVCKDRKIVYFYKMRTMHPYSEYIQKYVFDQRGGMDIADKSNSDWRITIWGRFMRRYWIDELPMLINWLKGDVKLVGVRPLSRTMFDTYPDWLQEKRTLTKPGLIPPFYIDHPKTFDELFASEDKYLTAYLKHPLLTDIRYFFRTMFSILFTKMHSA